MSSIENKSFGATLKAARERKNISVSNVSEALKLSIEIIENIEASNIAELPPAAFTCGYIRLFSKLVDINDEEVIHLYNQSTGVESISAAPGATSDIPAQASSEDLGMRIVSYSLGLVAIVLFIIWFQSTQEKPADMVVDVQESVTVVDEKADPKSDDLTIIEPVLTLDENAGTSEAEAVPELVSNDKPLKEINETVISDDADADADEIKKDKIIALANEANPVANSGTDVVLLTAKDDCWVEVSDANNQLLYFSLLKKDEVARLKGQEPFNVFLGKATAVVITLNDIEYDISKFVRSNQIARFTMSMDKILENQVRRDVFEKQNSN